MSSDADMEQRLTEQIELLASNDWRIVDQAHTILVAAGDAGVAATVRGLSHPNARIRRNCAGFLDHHGTNACVPALRMAARQDTIGSVRREAVHAFTCQRCKSAPLEGDMIPFLIERALSDPVPRVRREAVYGLSQQPADPRAAEALHTILAQDENRKVRDSAHAALQRHDPAYRQKCVEEAKQRARQRALSVKR
jgi:HEAT repeat protein